MKNKKKIKKTLLLLIIFFGLCFFAVNTTFAAGEQCAAAGGGYCDKACLSKPQIGYYDCPSGQVCCGDTTQAQKNALQSTPSSTPQNTTGPFAATASGGFYTNQEKIPGAAQQTGDITQYIKDIVNFGFAIIGILTMFMLMIGAYQYLMAAGNIAKVDHAKTTISSALLGLIIGICSWVLLRTINPDLVNPSLQVIQGIGGASPVGSIAGTSGNYTVTKSCKDSAVVDAAKKSASGSVNPCMLVAFASAESGCNSNAYNGTAKSGAWGMFQFLGSTAAGYGVSGSQLKGNVDLSMQTANTFINNNLKNCNGDLYCAQVRYRGVDINTKDPDWMKRYNSVASNCAGLGLAFIESKQIFALASRKIYD